MRKFKVLVDMSKCQGSNYSIIAEDDGDNYMFVYLGEIDSRSAYELVEALNAKEWIKLDG